MACPIRYAAGLPPSDLSLEECEARFACLLDADGVKVTLSVVLFERNLSQTGPILDLVVRGQ